LVAVVGGILALAGGAYAVARETSVFAVQSISVAGGSARVKAEVRKALAPELGHSLLRLDSGQLAGRVEAIPDVTSVRFDRAFPHTLRVRIRSERAVLLLRRGHDSWVVSSRGRVMRKITKPARSNLPRLWVRKSASVKLGQMLPMYQGLLAAAAVAPIASGAFPGGIRTVVSSQTELTLVLARGPQIRLGDVGDLRLKLAIAHRILRIAAAQASTAAAAYVDVSVPGRPVLGTSKP
jgi:cell division protein FtsQ